MDSTRRLLDLYLPPFDDMTLESFVATTYKVDWDFLEEELLPVALGVRTPVSRERAFRGDLERRLERTDVTVLYDLAGAEGRTRRSPRIDPMPIVGRKLHAKVSLLLWSAPAPPGMGARQWARLIVGSANLTKTGFRENYEIVTSLDFGMPNGGSGEHLLDAITLIGRIAGEAAPMLLAGQLQRFERIATPLVGIKAPRGVYPWQFVDADRALSRMADGWKELGETVPEEVVIVSPFWPDGEEPAKAVASLIRRFGKPERIVLVCGTATEVAGNLVPILPSSLAVDLKRDLGCRVVIRPSLLAYGISVEETGSGDETEEEHVGGASATPATIQRDLHAKCLAIRGRRASLLYIGSANCTRRGFGLGGMTNWEAGVVYRLASRETRIIDEILRVAGPPIEVREDRPPRTQPPVREADPPAATFLEEVVGQDTHVTVRLREGRPIPHEFTLLMPDHRDADRYFLILDRRTGDSDEHLIVARLEDCPLVDRHLAGVDRTGLESGRALMPWVEVRWDGHAALFPVRFDDKAALPRTVGLRRYTERELLDYFLYGRDPSLSGGDGGEGGSADERGGTNEEPVDTRRILSYFIRRFVEAIPGLEGEVTQALHSAPAMRAMLRGPTGVLELVNLVVQSLRALPARDEPIKTATAVGFQLVEIAGVLRRCRERVTDPEVREAISAALGLCLDRLDELSHAYPELTSGVFPRYRIRFVGDAR